MITPVKSFEIVTFTHTDEFRALGSNAINFPYQRISALWHNDGVFGQHIGEKNTKDCEERVLLLSSEVGLRLMKTFSAILEGQEVNCHRFSREIAGMSSSITEPILDFDNLPIADRLPEGSMGIIGVQNYGVPHSIGYGLDNDSLQVMSSSGELGFAENRFVVEFYRQLYPDHAVNLHQVS